MHVNPQMTCTCSTRHKQGSPPWIAENTLSSQKSTIHELPPPIRADPWLNLSPTLQHLQRRLYVLPVNQEQVVGILITLAAQPPSDTVAQVHRWTDYHLGQVFFLVKGFGPIFKGPLHGKIGPEDPCGYRMPP